MSISPPTAQNSRGLPLEVTSFVGRRHDRTRIRRLLETSRLVTLTGFGGMGKTRLALRVAHDLRRHFPDGAYFVPLSEIRRPEHVPDQIAVALGLEGRARDPAIWIVDYLRDRNFLLVLDNCEHVIDAAADIADRLLHTCPGGRLLATSREPLRIDGEAAFPVEPLAAPEPSPSAQPLKANEAVQLFVERAKGVVPDFELSETNRTSVAAVCWKLQGIPLALELAAARLRALSPSELENELSGEWEVLGRGSRNAPERQTTIAACIDWSFELCTPAEQRLWAETAVFVDGFELDAAASVCTELGGRSGVRDLLAALVDKSLLTISRLDGVSRFWMLPPIRHRGLHELSTRGRVSEIRRRHRDFYLTLLARAHKEWFTSRQLDWIARLRREVGNVREALDFCTTSPLDAEVGLRAMPHLMGFTALNGLSRQGRQWCEDFLERTADDPEARALGLRTAWWCAAAQGDIAAAADYLEGASAIAGEVGARTRLLLTQAAGINAQYRGHFDLAEGLLSEAATGLEEVGDLEELAVTYVMLTVNRAMRGDIEGALACHERALGIIPPEAWWFRSWTLWAAALAKRFQGQVEEAEALLRESLRQKRLISERLGIALILEELASLAVNDDPERAAVLLGAAQNEWETLEARRQAMPGLDTRHRDAESSVRTSLGEKAFEEAWARGRSFHREAAIAFALVEKPSMGQAPNEGSGGHLPLTRRQQQIAALVHEGLTNREIAEALVISPRTVDTHVENILTKLGFTSRAQVARWVAEQDAED